jgi:hypothetical protein
MSENEKELEVNLKKLAVSREPVRSSALTLGL